MTLLQEALLHCHASAVEERCWEGSVRAEVSLTAGGASGRLLSRLTRVRGCLSRPAPALSSSRWGEEEQQLLRPVTYRGAWRRPLLPRGGPEETPMPLWRDHDICARTRTRAGGGVPTERVSGSERRQEVRPRLHRVLQARGCGDHHGAAAMAKDITWAWTRGAWTRGAWRGSWRGS